MSSSLTNRHGASVLTKHATNQIVLPIIYVYCFKGKFRVRVGVGKFKVRVGVGG